MFLPGLTNAACASLLSGSKTYTVFAPTERAFQSLKDADLARLTSERAGARALVLKHIMPTTFYSAGMRYFQVRESMARGKQITIVNEEGEYDWTAQGRVCASGYGLAWASLRQPVPA